MAQDLLFPGNILSLHRAAVDKLARQGDGDAALLYLVLARASLESLLAAIRTAENTAELVRLAGGHAPGTDPQFPAGPQSPAGPSAPTNPQMPNTPQPGSGPAAPTNPYQQ